MASAPLPPPLCLGCFNYTPFPNIPCAALNGYLLGAGHYSEIPSHNITKVSYTLLPVEFLGSFTQKQPVFMNLRRVVTLESRRAGYRPMK